MSMQTSSLLSRQWTKLVGVLLIIIGSGGAITQLQQANIENLTTEQSKNFYEQQEQEAALNLSILSNVPSFGFDNLIADWTYLRFIQYMGDGEAREVTGYSLNPRYFQAVVEHDPRFLSAYFYLSPATTLFAGSPDISVQLLEKGTEAVSPENFPRAYYLWLYKGVDEMLFLGDVEGAIHSYEMAAKWASLQDTKEAQQRAKDARKTAQFLKENPLSKEARIGAWGSILSRATDDQTRELAIERIRRLGGDVTVTPEGNLQVEFPDSQEE